MTRLIVVLPVYFLLIEIIPRQPFYARFVDMVMATEGYMGVHFAAYVLGLIVSLIGWIVVERWTEGYFISPALRVLRAFLVGVLVTCGYQLYCFFAGVDLSVFMLMIPPAFVVAELVYEVIEGMIRLRRGAA